MIKKILLISLLILNILVLTKDPKIIGLVAVRNESQILPNCLKALSLYTDGIIILDDCSTDNTLEVINSLAEDCNIKKIITKSKWYRDEPGDKNKLLKAGRELGGTHFIMIDADEVFTANLLKNNILRKKILSLNPSEKLCLTWIQLWRSPDYYRYDSSVWSGGEVDIAFCDDKKCSYKSEFIHTSRTPSDLSGKRQYLVLDNKNFDYVNNFLDKNGLLLPKNNKNNIQLQRYLIDQIENNNKSVIDIQNEIGVMFWYGGTSKKGLYRNDFTAGVMHFQFVNWDNLLAKQAWYRCLEKIRNPNIDTEKINSTYGESKKEAGLRRLKAPKVWFEGYKDFFIFLQ